VCSLAVGVVIHFDRHQHAIAPLYANNAVFVYTWSGEGTFHALSEFQTPIIDFNGMMIEPKAHGHFDTSNDVYWRKKNSVHLPKNATEALFSKTQKNYAVPLLSSTRRMYYKEVAPM